MARRLLLTPNMRALLVAVLVAGCTSQAEPQEPPRDLAQKIIEIRDHMHLRFAAAENIRTAIALGDLERARADAQRIAALDEPDVLPAWRPYVDSIRHAARQIVLSTEARGAANMLALLGQRCGECHAASHARLAFPAMPSPDANQQLAAQMSSHQWATARMWEGLMGPSNAAWLAGAGALARADLAIVAVGGAHEAELGISDDVAYLRLLATRAQATTTLGQRGALYGELLGRCVHCHAAIRDGRAPPETTATTPTAP